jgi:hypothetical protein
MLHKSTGATRTIRSLISVLAVCALAGSASPAHAAPLTSGLAAATAELDVITNGNGTVTVNPPLDPLTSGTCTRDGSVPPCERREYAIGQNVTLTATPDAPASFVGWSDGRCPAAPTCSLPLDADRQAVTALFTLKHVWVRAVFSPGSETVTADGRTCRNDNPAVDGLDCGDFPLFSHVTLHAQPDPTDPFQTWDGSLCDPPVPDPDTQPDCTVNVVDSKIWASVAFGQGQQPDGTPPTVSVRFRVLKQGSGSGTVRSGAGGVDCGNSCVSEQNFGTRQNLVADPDGGSNFSGWRGACSTAPTCSLAVGPVTAVAAVFNALPSTSSSSSQPSSSPPPSRPATRFVARLRRFVVSGRGRTRRILIRVQVNARATVRATLTSRRGHRVTSKRWRLAAGSPLLRLKVPARTRRGTYRLALSMSDGRGHVVRVARRVRIPR